MLAIERHDGVAEIRLAREVINALDEELVGRLANAVEEIAASAGDRALVLTSANDKFFCIGFDLPRLLPLSRPEFQSFYEAFNRLCLRLFTLPKPTVAAIPGHATGGGCILALCCDYRFISAGRALMGLPEIKLGVPLPYPSDCILRALIGMRAARDITDRGELLDAPALQAVGLVDRVVPTAQLQAEARAWARRLGQAPAASFSMIKRNRVRGVEEEILARLVAREQYFLDCWFSAEARALLTAALDRFRR